MYKPTLPYTNISLFLFDFFFHLFDSLTALSAVSLDLGYLRLATCDMFKPILVKKFNKLLLNCLCNSFSQLYYITVRRLVNRFGNHFTMSWTCIAFMNATIFRASIAGLPSNGCAVL